MENNQPDLVTFRDENDNEIIMEVLDYFFYEGEEYATLIEYDPDSKCTECDSQDCESCDIGDEPVDVTIMKIVPVGDDEEEFVPIDDDIALKLVEMLNNGAFDDDDDDDE